MGVDSTDDTTQSITETIGGTQQKVVSEKEYIFKLVIVGDHKTGKTTLIRRLLTTHMPHCSAPSTEDDEDDSVGSGGVMAGGSALGDMPAVAPTVGTDFYSRLVNHVEPGTNVRLQLWDTAGLERYASVDETTYRNASLVVCIFDAHSHRSLKGISERHLLRVVKYLPEIEEENIFVVANKIDLVASDPVRAAARSYDPKEAVSLKAAIAHKDGRDSCSSTTELSQSDLSSNGATRASFAVCREDVCESLLKLFPHVHYAEVSAADQTGMPVLLKRLCRELLRNAGVPLKFDRVDIISGARIFLESSSSLPSRNGGTNQRNTLGADSCVADKVLLQHVTAETAHDDASPNLPLLTAPTAPVPVLCGGDPRGSAEADTWHNNPLYSFDMKTQEASACTAVLESLVFSPQEGESNDGTLALVNGEGTGDGHDAPNSASPKSPNWLDSTATPRGGPRFKKGCGVHLDRKGVQTAAVPASAIVCGNAGGAGLKNHCRSNDNCQNDPSVPVRRAVEDPPRRAGSVLGGPGVCLRTEETEQGWNGDIGDADSDDDGTALRRVIQERFSSIEGQSRAQGGAAVPQTPAANGVEAKGKDVKSARRAAVAKMYREKKKTKCRCAVM